MVTISRAAKMAQRRAVQNAPLNARFRADAKMRDEVMTAELRAYAEFPERYIIEKLGWTPWKGENGHIGQVEILERYRDAVMQQVEMLQLLRGEIDESQLRYYRPGMLIRNWIRVESGHGVGKTKIEAGIHSHFLDCFHQSIVISYANTLTQLATQLWKEIKGDRLGTDLPGRVLENEIKFSDPKHFSIGRATNAGAGTGTAKFQGQHAPYLLFILDEAEEIPRQIYDSMKAMSTGGVVVVLLVANPQTRTSMFHKIREWPQVINLRMRSIDHPNVVTGKELIREAVRRDRVEEWMSQLCTIVREHDEDAHTFELPWEARLANRDDPESPVICPPGTIFRPEPEFLWRMLGIAPPDATDRTLISIGRFESARGRGRKLSGAAARPAPIAPAAPGDDVAFIGLDAARYGLDYGTIYVLQGARMWREDRIQGQNTDPYLRSLKRVILALIDVGVKRISLRVDGGGGYGGGVLDAVQRDAELWEAYRRHQVHFAGHEVVFNAVAKIPLDYTNSITELYGAAADAIRGIAVIDAPEHLERDLTQRQFHWRPYANREAKELESKDDFKKREGRSPDDGDGFVLAAAPERLVIQEREQYRGSFSYPSF